MNRKSWLVALAGLLTVLPAGHVIAFHGFGGGGFRGGGGGFRGGGGYGGGGMHYGGMQSFGRTPSFSAPRAYGGYGAGMGYGGRGFEGMRGGSINYGARSGSYNTPRGGSINYGAAGAGARGPGGGEAGRGVYGVGGTTAGGRSFGDVGRVGGAVGPGGNAIAGRSNLGAVSGPRGTAVAGSRGFAAAGRGYYGASGYRPYGFNAYGPYHAGWVHGYWNGHNDPGWGWRNPYWGGWGLGMGLGMGLGWGLSSWGFGSSLYGMGYMPYSNPYYNDYYGGAGGAAVAAPYNYSQPIDTTSAPADEQTTNPAMALFDAARASFMQGNYTDALQKSDAALGTLPNDTSLHEFRALCLFALARYDEAAAALYAVLSVGPGWDWATLIGLYPDVNAYTAQVRALEEYCRNQSESASARFVLAYHYLTQGHVEAAVGVLKQVLEIKPGDTLTARLVKQLETPSETSATAPEATPAVDTAGTTPPQGASIGGTWNAQPAADTSIALTLQPDGKFAWQVTKKGQAQQFGGTFTYGQGMLTLVQDKGPVMVGRVDWKDPDHIAFRIVGDGPDDPGLSFSR
jgi:tetratricopeptide (TPR) repeat protein